MSTIPHGYPDDFGEMLRHARESLLPQLTDGAVGRPAFYIHLGGCFTAAAESLFDEEPPLRLPLHTLCPALPQEETAEAALPEFLYGRCREVPILALRGERRLADGAPQWAVTFPTALAAFCGITSHIYIDTGMSLHPDLKSGHWAMLNDFINGYAFSPVDGLRRLAPTPYADLSQLFSQHLNSELLNAMAGFGDAPMLTTFMGVPGFHICTHAEAKRHRDDGADLLGHELVLHLMLAAAFDCKVAAMVLAAFQLLPARPQTPLTRQEAMATAEFCTPQLLAGVKRALADLHQVQRNGMEESLLPEADADDAIHQNIRKAAAAGRSSPLKAFLKRG